VRAQQLFGIRHGVVAVATVHRIPGTCDERRVQRGGEMGRHQPSGRVQTGPVVYQPIRAQEPT